MRPRPSDDPSLRARHDAACCVLWKNRRLESSPLHATAVGMRQAGYLVHRAERLGEITLCKVEARRGVWWCAQPGTIAEGGEEDVSGTNIGTVLSAGIVDVFSDEVVNARTLTARSPRPGHGRR
jgi:hypothetical protein